MKELDDLKSLVTQFKNASENDRPYIIQEYSKILFHIIKINEWTFLSKEYRLPDEFMPIEYFICNRILDIENRLLDSLI